MSQAELESLAAGIRIGIGVKDSEKNFGNGSELGAALLETELESESLVPVSFTTQIHNIVYIFCMHSELS